MERIRFFKGSIPTKSRFHITVGHATVMAQVVLFKGPALAAAAGAKGAAAAAQAAASELAVRLTSSGPEDRDSPRLTGIDFSSAGGMVTRRSTE